MFNDKQLDHVTIAVKDLEEAKKKFEVLFGGKLVKELVMEKLAIKAAFYLVGETLIGLETPIGDGDMKKFLDKRGEGIHHVAFLDTNVKETEKKLREEGFRLVGPQVTEGVRTDLFVHPKSFFNIMLQIIEWEEPYRSSFEDRLTYTLNTEH